MAKKVVIDPGHGGTDPGAIGNGLKEKDYTLKISKYMADRFKELGIPVILTREEDITLSPDERTSKVLNAFGNNPDVIVVSNHLNAGGGDGAEVIYALRNNNTLANKILSSLNEAGQNIRRTYQRRLPSNPSKDYYFMHRNTGDTESVIVEYGFIDGKGDDSSQLQNNWEKYAEAVVKAVTEYAGYNYNPKKDNVYVVKKGDTLYSIARLYNTTVNNIKELNNLTSNIISIGQELVIDDKNKYNTYQIKSGDTLYSIARRFGTTVDEIKKLNNLVSNLLSISQIIKIP